ncbi:IS30 family transposase [Staphylococcus aureus]|nr:IS30 family transposase [Staphylococcus aureus]HDP5859494.1 IS30 family transposase [Staphylococcus aureus]HDP5872516.1 IS30 family transposase [Staphylococcus aureus]HDP5912088.1 IS30 family transposase [Staphylococcus aureus]HDP5938507.1 IS30 family transposase [Staphylococcus aureus]
MRLCIGPDSVRDRKEYGHYEIDTVLSGRPSVACLVTIIERKTRYLYACRLNSRCSKEVCHAVIELMRDLEPKTITVDRGKEFSMYLMIEEALNCRVYFSDPGCPGQRGSIENVNGLLRQYFPKGTDFKMITDESLIHAVNRINTRPRAVLDYLTSEEVIKAYR